MNNLQTNSAQNVQPRTNRIAEEEEEEEKLELFGGMISLRQARICAPIVKKAIVNILSSEEVTHSFELDQYIFFNLVLQLDQNALKKAKEEFDVLSDDGEDFAFAADEGSSNCSAADMDNDYSDLEETEAITGRNSQVCNRLTNKLTN